MTVNSPVPSAQRGQQMKAAGEMQAPEKTEGGQYRQTESLDALVDGMQRTMLANHQAEVKIMRGMNSRSVSRIVFDPEQILLRDDRVSMDVAQLVLDSDWTDREKYAVALANRERARLWAQMIALIPSLPAGTLNRLASLSYTTDQYIWDEDILRSAKLAGALTRWIAGKPRETQEQLTAALVLLEKAPAGTKITLTNGRRADDACVEISFPGPALAGVAS
jgi:hypothetical protein